MRAGTCYVISGLCRYRFDEAFDLQENDILMAPGGNYEFEVSSTGDVDLVWVWELPAQFHTS